MDLPHHDFAKREKKNNRKKKKCQNEIVAIFGGLFKLGKHLTKIGLVKNG